MAVSVNYVVKETATNLWRNRMMALAAILTVAVSLSLVGAALLLRQAANRQIGAWSNNVNSQIFVNANATSTQIAAIRAQISQTPQIVSCTYVDHEQSYQQAKQVLAGDPTAIDALSPSTVPTVFRCQLKSPSDAATVTAIFNGGVPGVYKATDPGQSVKVMQEVTGTLQLVLLVIAIVLLVSSLVLILNAIRMAIFARRREVGVMKLVGATNWFIRVPFMLEGLVQGVLGAVVAVVAVLLSSYGVSYIIKHYKVTVLGPSIVSSHDLLMTELLVVAIGIVVGVFASSVAVRRFLDV